MRFPLRLLAFTSLIRLTAAAAETPPLLHEVIVTPSKFGVTDEATTRGTTLTSRELESLPQVGDDLYRSVARLPGLAGDDFTARFWVRGAPNGQLLARLDGVDLVEPFHLKDVDGALSIVDPQTISRLDLTTGGFTAEYGDRLAGVLSLESKIATTPLTSFDLSLTGVGARSLGSFHRSLGRWLVAARRGYPDVALRAAGRDDEITPRYYDATAQVEYVVLPGHTVSLHALHAGDTLTYRRANTPSLSSSYESDYLWGRWLGKFGSTIRSEAVVSYTHLAWNRDGNGSLDGFPFSLRDRRNLRVLGLRNDWSITVNEALVFRTGLETKSADSRYAYNSARQYTAVVAGRQTTASATLATALRPQGQSTGAFAIARFQPISSLVVEPGLRFDRHTATGDSAASPRLNVALLAGDLTLRAAWGAYRQAQGLQELAIADGESTFHRAELAEHRVLGLDYPLGPQLRFRAEIYERLSTRVRPRWENLDNGYDLFPEAQSDRVRLAPSRGRARGLEFMLAGRVGRQVTWNSSYTLARAEELLAGRWTPRARDQRHTFYSDVTYTPNARWQLSASWQFHTGWPTTDVISSLANLTNGRRVVVSANGPIYALRLPDYHRLDLRVTRRWVLPRSALRVYFDLFNAYDRTNIIGYDHRVTVSGTQVTDSRKPREQLPFLPSAGLSWEF